MYGSPAVGCSWKYTLNQLHAGLDWTGLSRGAAPLASGLYSGPTEDKIGPFPWWETYKWDIENAGGKTSLNFT